MNLELAKKRLDLKKMETSLQEYEYKVLERMADIERIKGNIDVQEKAIEKVKQEIVDMEASDG